MKKLLKKNLKIFFAFETTVNKPFPGKSYILGLDFWIRIR